ncbi:PKD domain-containing protein, partial [bacterium]|nr:PKD domain-containing protein [bacterium]
MFTDTTIGATSWAWTFGDNGTSEDQNPVHTYTTAGNYTVSLTVTDEGENSDTITKTDYITVVEPVVLAAGWNAITSGTTEDLNDILFLNETKGFIVGNTGLFMKTTNGGGSWETIETGLTNNINAISFYNDLIGIMVGSRISGLSTPIYITADGGDSWTPVESGITVDLLSVTYKNSTTIYAVGWSYVNSTKNSKLIVSNDGGITWTSLPHPLDGYNIGMEDICFADENNGYISSNGGLSASALIYTHDGGTNWSITTTINGSSLQAVTFINSDLGFYGGGSYVYKSENGGSSWSSSIYAGYYGVYDIDFLDESNGFTVGYQGGAAYTTDSGETWIYDPSPSTSTLFTAEFQNDSLVWTVGSEGALYIYKFTPGVINALQSPIVIEDYNLKQNYP